MARRAGVGVGTVSRVINDSGLVSERTHARVRRAIEELGYRPNAHARSLSLGRSQAVGVVAPFFTTPSVVERVRGASRRLVAGGYDLILFDVETPAQRVTALTAFAARDRIDGLIVISLQLSSEEVSMLARGGPAVVTVDVVNPSFPSVATDDVLGGELAAEHLLEKGHRRIGFIGDQPVNPFGFTSSERRREGFRKALERHGVQPSPIYERRGQHGRDQARALAVGLLRRDDRPTAVFAASDVQAVGVLEAASVLDLRVPEDLAVIGFDDIEVAGMLGLTTVRQPLYATGARAADLVMARIEGRPVPQLRPLEPLRVVARRTT